jgi:glycosyltransferase involved in cell wall biosynthesis
MYKSKLHILVISNCPLHPDQGSGYVILGYCREMIKRGHFVQSFGPEDYLLFPSVLPAKRLRLFIGYTLKALREAIASGKRYDIVELWGAPGWLSILLLRFLKRQDLLVVSRSNGLEPHYRQISSSISNPSRVRRIAGMLESRLDEVGFRCASGLTVVSSFDEAFARKCGYKDSNKLLSIENPLPDQWLNRACDNKPKTPVIGFVGSWIPRKGSELVIEIINLVYQDRPDIKWIIAGIGPEGKKQIADHTAIDTGDVYESVGKKKLEELYSRMSLLLCLSSYESFGLVCAEAMSFGCTLIATSVGFMYGLKDGREYVAIDRQKPDGIADLLVSLAGKPGVSWNIARNGYKRVQSLQWSVAAERLESFYMSLIVER